MWDCRQRNTISFLSISMATTRELAKSELTAFYKAILDHRGIFLQIHLQSFRLIFLPGWPCKILHVTTNTTSNNTMGVRARWWYCCIRKGIYWLSREREPCKSCFLTCGKGEGMENLHNLHAGRCGFRGQLRDLGSILVASLKKLIIWSTQVRI